MSMTIGNSYARPANISAASNYTARSNAIKKAVNNEPLKLDIRTEMPKIYIDQYEAFASIGLKNNMDFLLEIKQNSYSNVMKFIGKTASDGQWMRRSLETGENVIAAIARRDMTTAHDFGLAAIPEKGPDFTFVRGSVKIELK